MADGMLQPPKTCKGRLKMEVVIHSSVTGLLGTTVLSTDPEQTVGRLISAFCRDKGIDHRLDLVLTNCRQEVLHKRRKLIAYNVRNGEELYLSLKESSDEWSCGCNQWYVLSAVTFFIGAVGLAAVCVIRSHDYDYTFSHSYGIVLDAGSTHTALYVFKWPGKKHNGTGVVEQVLKCPPKSQKMSPISSFADDPSEAGRELLPCLERAKDAVPKHKLAMTPVFLGATAGMRLLRAANETAAEAIMTSVRDTIATYPFLLQHPEEQIRILSGTEEGVFGWITTNYLSGNFGFQPLAQIDKPLTQLSTPQHKTKTVGGLDMGGASTEITFIPENTTAIERGYNQSVQLYGTMYEMYTFSYECYGLNEAYRRYLAHLVQASNSSRNVSDPCGWAHSVTTWSYEDIFRVPCTLPQHSDFDPDKKGAKFTFTGTDKMATCHGIARQLLKLSSHCPFSHCSFNATYQPPLYGQFCGFSGYYKTMEDLNLVHKETTLHEFTNAVKHCTKILSPAQNSTNCFKVQYISVLLTEGYGFNSSNWDTLHIEKKLNGVELGWVVGMMINMTSVVPKSADTESLSLPVFVLLVILFVAFLVISVAFLCHARKCPRVHEVLPSTTTYGAI